MTTLTFLRPERRTVLAVVLVAVATLAVSLVALCYGDGWARPGAVVDGLRGEGPLAGRVLEWRMPRVTAAVVFGLALGLAGALFQNLTRNPLGAPDVIGLDQGAYTGVLLVLTVAGGAHFAAAADNGGGFALGLAGAALAGGLLAAGIVALLAMGSGYTGYRLIVIGIAVNAVLTAANSWLILRADLEVAMAAASWSAGNLNGTDWSDLVVPLAGLAALAVAAGCLARPVQQLALGDDVAVTTGIRLGRLRLAIATVGVGCTAIVAATAGPIVFVALMAPQIGRRLAGTAGIALLPSALTGALLLGAADLLAQVVAPVQLPVGVVTGAIGGVYLLWLLFKEVGR
ncbi:FecCD family ABC transporter permease [Pimelobacter simplex]|uniref:FecCD family ABC transporter permease n=1 Tax=Nocardioides simplex TaxID=2045 RepID=UPI003816DEBA